MDGLMHGCMDRWRDGGMDGCMHGWMDGWMDDDNIEHMSMFVRLFIIGFTYTTIH